MRTSRPFATVSIALLLFATSCSYLRSTLEIEAQIIYNMGGPQPVARTSFYLLDKDPFTLRADDPDYREREAKLDETGKTNLALQGMFFFLLKKAVEDNKIPEGKEKTLVGALENSKPFWESHVVQSATTDFKGNAKFKNLSPGTYWLMGITETRAAFAFWKVKVDLKRGENKLLLDQNNATYSK